MQEKRVPKGGRAHFHALYGNIFAGIEKYVARAVVVVGIFPLSREFVPRAKRWRDAPAPATRTNPAERAPKDEIISMLCRRIFPCRWRLSTRCGISP